MMADYESSMREAKKDFYYQTTSPDESNLSLLEMDLCSEFFLNTNLSLLLLFNVVFSGT